MAGYSRSFVCDEVSKDLEDHFPQSPTLGERGNPTGSRSVLSADSETNNGQPDDLAESIFSCQEEDEEDDTADVTAGVSLLQEPAYPPLATGIYPDFLARHTTDVSLLDQPPAGAAVEALLSDGVPNLPQNNVQDLRGPMLPQDIQANASDENEVHVSRTNKAVEHFEGGECSHGILADDDNIHRLMSETCGGHLCSPACRPLDDHNLCCHCSEEAVVDYVYLPCFHKIHCNCLSLRLQRHMRTCPVCGRVF